MTVVNYYMAEENFFKHMRYVSWMVRALHYAYHERDSWGKLIHCMMVNHHHLPLTTLPLKMMMKSNFWPSVQLPLLLQRSIWKAPQNGGVGYHVTMASICPQLPQSVLSTICQLLNKGNKHLNGTRRLLTLPE